MTSGSPDGSPESSAATRELARQKARLLREQHRKQERRGRLLIQGGIVVVLIAIVAVVAVSILNSIRPPSPGPLNMLSDGIQIGKNLVATKTAALQPDHDPVATDLNAKDVVAIRLYTDYLSPEGGSFAKANTDQIITWLDSGAATIEIHPISMLNSRSHGTQYSTRAANAAGCVANYDPNAFFVFSSDLLTREPKESEGNLSDDELFSRAKAAGITSDSQVRSCINGIRFQNWVKQATDRALDGPLPNSDPKVVVSDPLTVLVNGTQYTGDPKDAQAFAAFVVQAAGVQFSDGTSETATATATPTVTAAPTETPTPAPTATKK